MPAIDPEDTRAALDRANSKYRAWMDREREQQRKNSELRAAQDQENRRWYLGGVPGLLGPVITIPGRMVIPMDRIPVPVTTARPAPAEKAAVATCPRCGAPVCMGHRRITLP